MTLDSSKISTSLYNNCGNNGNSSSIINLSNELLSIKSSNDTNYIDCNILSTNYNLYAVSHNNLISSSIISDGDLDASSSSLSTTSTSFV